MDDRTLFFLVLFPLVSVGGVALLWIGLSGLRKARRRQERERASATGAVVDITKRYTLRRGMLYTCHPVVEFDVDGRTRRYESETGYWPDMFRVGEHVDLRYDADDPSRFHLEKGAAWQEKADRATVAAGLVWIAVAAVVAYFVSG